MTDWQVRLRELLSESVPRTSRGVTHAEVSRDALFAEFRRRNPESPPEEPGESFQAIEAKLEDGVFDGDWRITYTPAGNRISFDRVFTADGLQRQAEFATRYASARLLELVTGLNGFSFQRFVVEVFRNLPWVIVVQSSRLTNDGGVDFHAIFRQDDLEGIRVAGQVKRTTSPIEPAPVREFIGAFLTAPGQHVHYGVFVSLGGYSDGAIEVAKKSPIGLTLYSWPDILRWLMTYGIGITKDTVEVRSINEKFWDEVRA